MENAMSAALSEGIISADSWEFGMNEKELSASIQTISARVDRTLAVFGSRLIPKNEK